MQKVGPTTFNGLISVIINAAKLDANMRLGICGYLDAGGHSQSVVFAYSTNGRKEQVHTSVYVEGVFGDAESKVLFKAFEAAGITATEMSVQNILFAVASFLQSSAKIRSFNDINGVLGQLMLPYVSGVKLLMYNLSVGKTQVVRDSFLSNIFGSNRPTKKRKYNKKAGSSRKVSEFQDIEGLSPDSVLYLEEIRAYWKKYGNTSKLKAPYSPQTTIYVSGVRARLEKLGFKANDSMVATLFFGDPAAVGRLRLDNTERDKLIKAMFDIVDDQRKLIEVSKK